jgi:hypothetical protein
MTCRKTKTTYYGSLLDQKSSHRFSSAETACTPIKDLFGKNEGIASYEGFFTSSKKLIERFSPFTNSSAESNQDHDMECAEHFTDKLSLTEGA